MGTVIVKNPWVLKKQTLSDGSAVFNLESREIPGTVVRIGCYDEGKATLLQMQLGESAAFLEVDEAKPAAAPKSNLLAQASEVAVSAAACLCGIPGGASPEFRNVLREIPPLAAGYTIGDIARAYLAKKLAELTITTKAA